MEFINDIEMFKTDVKCLNNYIINEHKRKYITRFDLIKKSQLIQFLFAIRIYIFEDLPIGFDNDLGLGEYDKDIIKRWNNNRTYEIKEIIVDRISRNAWNRWSKKSTIDGHLKNAFDKLGEKIYV